MPIEKIFPKYIEPFTNSLQHLILLIPHFALSNFRVICAAPTFMSDNP